MSIRFSGTLKRSAGIASAIAKQLRLLNLKPVKNIVVKFDPFNDNVTETRYVIFVVYFGTISFEATISTRFVTS
jgi:large subunit ribosomal protein L53